MTQVDPGCPLTELQTPAGQQVGAGSRSGARPRAPARKLLPLVAAMLDDPQPMHGVTRRVGQGVTRRVGQGVTMEKRDRTGCVRLVAARAIVAAGEPNDPLVVRARELLAQMEQAPAGK